MVLVVDYVVGEVGVCGDLFDFVFYLCGFVDV